MRKIKHLFLILSIFVLFMLAGCDFNYIEAEVRPYQNMEHQFTITNRNDFTWTNMSLTVNQYYECVVHQEELAPNEDYKLGLNDCEDYPSRYMALESIKIETNQGVTSYGR